MTNLPAFFFMAGRNLGLNILKYQPPILVRSSSQHFSISKEGSNPEVCQISFGVKVFFESSLTYPMRVISRTTNSATERLIQRLCRKKSKYLETPVQNVQRSSSSLKLLGSYGMKNISTNWHCSRSSVGQ